LKENKEEALPASNLGEVIKPIPDFDFFDRKTMPKRYKNTDYQIIKVK